MSLRIVLLNINLKNKPNENEFLLEIHTAIRSDLKLRQYLN